MSALSRRGFLGLLAAGVVVGPELAELLKPRPTIFLPPRGGWVLKPISEHGGYLVQMADMAFIELLRTQTVVLRMAMHHSLLPRWNGATA